MAVRGSHRMKVYGAWLFSVPEGTTLDGLENFPLGEEAGWELKQFIPGRFWTVLHPSQFNSELGRGEGWGTFVSAIGKGDSFEAEVFTV